MGETEHRPHSAAFFGPERDFWWNRDQLELIASRRGLADVRTVLDVGCGVGHWGTLLGSVLPADATVAGIEREPEWVEAAARRAERLGFADRFRYQQGTAESLPFDDASFDLVTCQTLLIHVADPRAVIREMLRVTRPGGHVIAAEPNNLAAFLVGSSLSADAEIEDLVDLTRFCLTCERGKAALGEGNGSVGDLLPGYFVEEGLVDVEAFLSDKPAAMFPPYSSEEQQALKAYHREAVRRGTWGWTREEARRFFLAGGGEDAAFAAAWQRRMSEARAVADATDAGTYHSAGGTILYLVAGRRPG